MDENEIEIETKNVYADQIKATVINTLVGVLVITAVQVGAQVVAEKLKARKAKKLSSELTVVETDE